MAGNSRRATSPGKLVQCLHDDFVVSIISWPHSTELLESMTAPGIYTKHDCYSRPGIYFCYRLLAPATKADQAFIQDQP